MGASPVVPEGFKVVEQPQQEGPQLPAGFRIVSVEHPDPLQRSITRPEQLPSQQEFDQANNAAATTMRQALQGGPRITAAPPPTGLDRLKSLFFGSPQAGESALGRAIQGTKLGDAMGVPRTETFTNPEYATDLPLIKPTALAPSNPTSVAGGVGKGVATVAEGLTTAPNLLMAGAGPAMGMLGKVSSLLPKAISAGFTLQMLGDLSHQVPQVKKAIDGGDPAEIAQSVTEAIATGALAVMAGKHALSKGKAPIEASRSRPAPKDWGIAPDREEYLKKLAEQVMQGKTAKQSAEVFDKAGPTYTELFDKAIDKEDFKNKDVTITPEASRMLAEKPTPTTEEGSRKPSTAKEAAGVFKDMPVNYAELFSQAEERQTSREKTAKGQAARPPKATVPEEGIPSHVSRIVDARDRVSRQLAGKPFRELGNSDRMAVDDLVIEGHGFGVTPDEVKIPEGFRVVEQPSTDVPRGTPTGKQGAKPEPAASKVTTKAEVPEVTPTKETGAVAIKAETSTSVPRGTPKPPVQTVQETPKPREVSIPPEQAALSASAADGGKAASSEPAPSSGQLVGRQTEIPVEGRSVPYKARYVVRELGDVQASHNGLNFEPNPKYGIQNDRDYQRNEHIAQLVVERSAPGNFKPERILSDIDNAEAGPTIIDAEGNALGGNSRKMVLDRVYQRKGADTYRQGLLDRAKSFGLDPAEIEKMKQPVLLREVTDAKYDRQAAVTDFNKSSQSRLSPEEQMVADGRRLSKRTVDDLATRLGDLGDEGTIATALRGDNGVDVLNRLEADGVVTGTDKKAYLDDKNQLTPDIKARIGKALVGRLFNEPKEVTFTPPEMRNKLERVAPQALRVEGRKGWDVTQDIRDAIAYNEDLRRRGSKKITISTSAGRKPLDELVSAGLLDESRVDQLTTKGGRELTAEGKKVAEDLWRKRQETELMSSEDIVGNRNYSPRARQLAQVLQESPRNVEYAFRRYANDAEHSKEGAQQAFFEPPTPEQAFADAFGEPEPVQHHALEQPMIDFEQKVAGKAQKPKTRAAEIISKFARNEEGGIRPITVQDVRDLRDKLAESNVGVGVGALGQSLRSLGARLKAEGGGEGRTLMALIEHADDAGVTHAGQLLARIADTQPSRLSKSERFEVLDAMEGRTAAPKDPRVRAVYDAMKEADTELGLRATGLGLEVSTRNGKRPFAMMQNHFPHVLRAAKDLKRGVIRDDVVENLQRLGVKPDKASATKFLDDWVSYLDSGKRKQSLLDYLVDTKQARDEADALAKLERYRSHIKRQGSLEFARDVNLPFYDPDPVRVMPFSLFTGAKRLAQVATFGQDHRVINQEILKIMRAGGNTDFVRDAVDRMLDVKVTPDDASARASQFLRSLSTLKMSLSAIPNATQVLNAAVASDLPSFAAGLRRAANETAGNYLRDKLPSSLASKLGPRAREIAVESGAAIDPVLNEARKAAGGTGVMDKYLKGTGFSATERFNRVVSANAGIEWAKRNLEAAKGKGRSANAARLYLGELGIDPVAALRRGELTERDMLQAAKRFSDMTQFRARPQDLPGFATDSPWGKAWFQFKGFAYQQARFAYDQTWKELQDPNTRPRGLRNLTLMGAVFPMVAGEGVNAIRAAISGRDEKKKKGLLKRYFDDLAAASSAGILLDAVQAAQQDRSIEFLAGPAAGQVSDFAKMMTAVADTDKTYEQKKRAVEKYALSRFGSATGRLAPK